ncbi:glycosyltransferase family 39 protein [Dyadobacter sandarakinus]|uniref:Glycosyltransferase family 39 protein n=2 Tax=Dyadobacter sandarakinus TaxID=2747268 RepID=A0ABX7IDZ9_9BACT|nr:glycosyltransferase family 39 protein [Dyadobacter sandarakinus]
MEPDGALYATIAKHIVLHRDWLNLFGDGHDWLDKPHFPFWMAALSYKLFGITGFGYKLPAFLFWLAGIYYTYLTARDLFNRPTAILSITIYAVALHSTLFNFDVRAEPYLTTCIVGAVWHMLRASRGAWLHLLPAALFAACGVMTKGIFVLATIGGGWVIYWIIAGQWQEFLNYRWWIFAALCLLFIMPELYSLYTQFDLHPEKIVFGRTHVSGIRFFFWDSQFGRFFNTGPIKGSGSPAFFLHTTLWAFLPWSAALTGAVIYLVRFDREREPARWIVYGSTLITFALFSFSGFQLPHYIVILFPYFAIISAFFLQSGASAKVLKALTIIQVITLLATGVAIGWLLFRTGIDSKIQAGIITLVLIVAGLFLRGRSMLESFLIKGYAVAAVMYVFLFFFFYPFLLQYQAGRQAAVDIPQSHQAVPAAIYGVLSYSFEFYAPQDVQVVRNQQALGEFLANKPCYLFTSKTIADSLLHSGLKASTVAEKPYYRITRLKPAFINQKTRSDVTEARSLLYVN